MSLTKIAGVDVVGLTKVMGVDLEAGSTLTAAGQVMIPGFVATQIVGPSDNLIDATDEKSGVVFTAPKTGTIDRVCFRTNTVTTGWTADVRLETVGDDDFPSGSLVAANTNASQAITNGNDNTWFEVTLTAGAPVTKGVRYAIVVVYAASGNGNIATYGNATAWTSRAVHYTTSWAANRIGIGAVRYNDATYPPCGMMPLTALGSTTVASNTNPDEVGIKFTPPVGCVAAGAYLPSIGSWVDGDDFDVVLYDSGSSALATKSMTSNPANIGGLVLFATPVTLDAGSVYRLVVKPTTTNSFTLNPTITIDSSSRASAAWGITEWTLSSTHRTDAGSWTDPATTLYPVALVVEQFFA